MRDRKCRNCGEKFDFGARSDKLFCDGTCRKQFQRKRKSIRTRCNGIVSEINMLAMLAKRHPVLRDEITEELKVLMPYIKDVLRNYDVETMQEEAQKADLISRIKKM